MLPRIYKFVITYDIRYYGLLYNSLFYIIILEFRVF